jgi:hypothetical protein
MIDDVYHNAKFTLPQTPTTTPNDIDRREFTIRELLDHIAVELAHEYLQLMEAAAEDRCDTKADRTWRP